MPTFYASNIFIRLFIFMVCVAVIVFSSWFFYWGAAFSNLAFAEVKVSEQQVSLRQDMYRTHLYVDQNPARLNAQKQVLSSLLIMAPDVSSVLITRKIDELAKQSHVSGSEIRWLDEVLHPRYREKTFELMVSGNFLALEQFFKAIKTQQRLIYFSYSQWRKSDESGGIVVIAKGHVYQWVNKET